MELVAGASFAAAHVTGLVALLRELTPQMKPQQIHDMLAPAGPSGLTAARPLMIDAWAAIVRAAAACACTVTRVVARSLPPD